MSIENAAANPKRRVAGIPKFNQLINKFGIYSIIILFIVLGTILFQGKFLSPQNFLNIIDALTILGIAAIGVAFVTYSGHYADLSIPTTMAFAGIVAIEALRFGIVLAVLAAISTGLVLGLVNAFAIGKLKANPIIWTLAMAFVTKGLMRWIWLNKAIYPSEADPAAKIFLNLYRMNIYGRISLPLVTVIILAILAQVLLTRTQFGKQLKVVGASYEVAKMTGINVTRLIGGAFLLSAFTAAIVGIFITSLGKMGAYYQGAGYDFDAVTAIVISGMTLSGGRGDIIGVLGGVFLVGLLKNILTLLGVGTFSQGVIQGLMFIIVVGLHTHALRKSGRDNE